jgi:hypothetical protein
MKYIVEIEFDERTVELTPTPLEVRTRIAYEMNSEYGESGYRTTRVFVEEGALARRQLARWQAGIEVIGTPV